MSFDIESDHAKTDKMFSLNDPYRFYQPVVEKKESIDPVFAKDVLTMEFFDQIRQKASKDSGLFKQKTEEQKK